MIFRPGQLRVTKGGYIYTLLERGRDDPYAVYWCVHFPATEANTPFQEWSQGVMQSDTVIGEMP